MRFQECPYKHSECKEPIDNKRIYLCGTDLFFKCNEYNRIISEKDYPNLNNCANPFGRSAEEFISLMR